MGTKTLLCTSAILLIVTVNFAYGGRGDNGKNDNKGRSKGKDYGGGMDGYHDNEKQVIGEDGIDPRADGIDVADFGPVYGKGRSMYSSLNVWISEADDWLQTKDWGKKGGKGSKYGSNKKYNNKDPDRGYKNDGYDNDDYQKDDYKKDDYKNDDYKKDDYQKDDYQKDDYQKDDYQKDDYEKDDYKKDDYKKDGYKKDGYKKDGYGGQRRKRSYKKYNLPVKQIKNYRKFPFSLFPPLISIAPWLPIFYDKLTYQTFIFSLEGGIIIIPPVINFYGQRFAIAQLIKWGYASLVSSGVPPPIGVNVAPLIQPAGAVVAGGAVAGGAVAGGAVAGGGVAGGGVAGGGKGAPHSSGGYAAPTYNSKTHQFNGGVKTDLPSFRPRPNYLQEGQNNGPPPANSPKYSN